MGYDAPQIQDLGTLAEMTQGGFNKVGPDPDVFTAITNGVVVGSLVPVT